MNKRVISAVVSLAMLASAAVIPMTAQAAEAKTPQYQTNARQMEQLNRGLIAVKTAGGVYLSWRLLGTESLSKQGFDIYKDGTWIETIEGGEATCWTDPSGTADNEYVVVKEDGDPANETPVKPMTNTVGDTYSYMDVPVDMPNDSLYRRIELKDKNGKHAGYGGGINDASVGDLDGDGDYEFVLKWDPSNSKDAASGGTTGRVYLDGYEISEDNTDSDGKGHMYKWRIDLGPHVRAGAHETPFLVYDFDGDGCAEIVSLTGPGAIDGTGHYVTEAGDTDEIKNADNTLLSLNRGKNIGPEYYTIFDGKTGKALRTTEAILIGSTDGKNWGKNLLNESQRYLAAVAYLDGVHPSIVMCRGYYYRAALRAYTWDGNEMAMQWEYDCGQSGVKADSLYRQGNHNLSVGDIDDDGRDEIVYGSAALDDDGQTVLGNTLLGHGDAMHLSDFNNDGKQEVMSVKEHEMKKCAENFRDALTGKSLHTRNLAASGDNGRGIMDNMDDEYAKANPNALAISWSADFAEAHDLNGEDIGPKAGTAARSGNTNFLVYWDDDLGRELLDTNIICKYHAPGGNIDRLATFDGVTANNSTKSTPSLSADLWGDWREEVVFGANDTQEAIDAGKQPALRIYTSNIPTQYRLATLMHDSQYRLAIAWQNIAYNQPPHTSYYIGSAALATDKNGNELNYLAPAVPYTKVTYDAPAQVDVTDVEIKNKEIMLEQGKTTAVNAVIVPADATKKGIDWTSSNTSVATVSNGTVKGVGVGTATITATTKDGGHTDTCEVTVYSTPVTGVSLSDKIIEFGIGNTASLTATVYPDNASDKSVTWSSDDTSVAEVNGDGVVTGVGLGKTTITATADGKTAKCIVKVKPMSIVDATGDDAFVMYAADADKVTFSGEKNSASLTLAETTGFVEFHKDFQELNKNTATLSFHFTTGGAKTDGDYIWKKGHTYNTELKFLDTDGNKLFDIIEQHTTSGNTTYYSVGEDGWQNASSWKKVASGEDTAWNRSQIRWDVNVTFDYAEDTGTINLAGCNSSWVRGEVWETTFPLNGNKFKTLKYETNTIADWVSGTPKLEQLYYTATEQISGNTDVLYEKGTSGKKWTENDLTDWEQTGTDTAALQLDSENGRVWYNPTEPKAEYSAEKTFDVTPGAIVSYDVDWHFGSAVGRDGNYEYLQLGNMRLGYTNGYKLLLSTDGGATYGENPVFTGENTTYIKNVNAMFNTASKTVTLSLDGKQIYSGEYGATDEFTADGANLVKFGFTRAGAAPNWVVPNGIDRIRVAQFVEGEEAPDFSTIKVTEKNGKTAVASYTLLDYAEPTNAVTLIGALYDGDELVEVKSQSATLPDAENGIIKGTGSVEFNNDIGNYTVKIFMWDSLNGMKPFADAK